VNVHVAIHKYNNLRKIILNGQTPLDAFNGFETDFAEIKKVQRNCKEEKIATKPRIFMLENHSL
jgi:hypothetical protein